MTTMMMICLSSGLIVLANGAWGVEAGTILAATQHATTLISLIVAGQSFKLEFFSIAKAAILDTVLVQADVAIGIAFALFRVGQAVVKMDEHVREQEDHERKRVQNEDIRDTVNSGVCNQIHLLLSRTHKEKSRRIE